MGEFSYTQADASYGGEFSYTDGYAEGGFDGYQSEVQSLVPEGVPMVGAILMEKGVITPEQIGPILAKQAETGDTFVQILMDDGYAAPDQLLDALQTRAAYR